LKSDVRDLLRLALLVYDDACARCTVNVSDLRDKNTIMSRVKKEGVSFLTITLPSFARDFEYCLALGRIDPSSFRGFRKNRSIPAFLQGMIGLLFDRETGRRLDEYESPDFDDAIIVDSVRQVCRTFNKLLLDCTPARVAEAIQGFVQTERDLEEYRCSDDLLADFMHVSHLLFTIDRPAAESSAFGTTSSGRLLDDLIGQSKKTALAEVELNSLWPTHGPGATAEGISGNQKYVWQNWHERLELYFPFLENGYSISAFGTEEFENVSFIPSCQELPVKVTPVPKTLKGPRIIAIEPVCMQYTQQAIRRCLYDILESSRMTAGHVNFTDQSVNQKMALMASIDGSLATIDLSEASDRVPRDLALHMFDGNPDLRDAIDACRSTHAKLPDGTIIGPLKKFASMGSALCFPIESMYFYTVCILALLREHNLPVTSANTYKVSRDVFVYGDDIIVPSDMTVAVLRYLQLFGCKVNKNKTFWHGFFRESCGLDAYKGTVVTPIYIRRTRPKNRRQVSELISWCATANLLYKKGYWRTCSFMFDMIERVIGPLPYIAEDTPGLGRISFLGYRSIERWNRDLHRFEVRTMVPEAVRRTDELSGYAALQKCLLNLHTENPLGSDADPSPFRNVIPKSKDKKHLASSVLHGVATLKRRWVPA
jgi:hypothetical protein